ncbi:MAG: Crp/Fnr family transcriptional regulator [Deltaproteobacteria bacterium]
MQITAFLSTIPLFNGLSEQQYLALGRIARELQFDRGQTIFSEGDQGKGFFVVASGQIKIFKLSIDGKEQILHVFGPGEPFAEVAVFTGSDYPAHALAMKKSKVLFFPRQAFMDLLGANPSLAMNMLASLSLRLKKFANMIEALSLKEVPGRLAAHLLYLRQRQNDADTLHLNLPKGQLASLLGTIPETLSRILAKMTQQGLLKVDGNVITVLDTDGLEHLACGERRL